MVLCYFHHHDGVSSCDETMFSELTSAYREFCVELNIRYEEFLLLLSLSNKYLASHAPQNRRSPVITVAAVATGTAHAWSVVVTQRSIVAATGWLTTGWRVVGPPGGAMLKKEYKSICHAPFQEAFFPCRNHCTS